MIRLVALVVLSNVAGNFALSWGVKHGGGSGLAALMNPWVAAGVALLIVFTISRMVLLGRADLSYVLPVTAIGYVLTALAGLAFLKETIAPARWAGIALIVAGIVLVGGTRPRTS
ncbi:MAG TPA: transporter [Solibacterales bacterium]|nr:transporter [Bryobacterales bacterium]